MKRVVNGIIKQFDVEIDNRVGALADVCEVFAKNAVNIKAIATGILGNGMGVIQIITEDENTTRKVLEEAKLDFREHDILSLKLMDRPGELAKIARLISRAGVNIDSIFILGKDGESTEVGLRVDKMGEARGALT